jgi:hypothetical protein
MTKLGTSDLDVSTLRLGTDGVGCAADELSADEVAQLSAVGAGVTSA